MRPLLTRALPAAVIVIAAGVTGFFAYPYLGPYLGPYLVRPPMLGATASLAVAQAPAVAHASTDSTTTARTATSEADGKPPQGTIPDALPDIAFKDRTGAPRRFSDWKGRPLLVNFWATWCGPCQEEIPLLERLSRERARQGLQVIGVAVDARPAVLDYARRASIQYPLLIGEQPGLAAVRALGVPAAFPFSVFVDTRGRIVTLKVGEMRTDQAALILDRLDDLDRGRIDLATARQEIADGMSELAAARAQAGDSTRF